MKAAICGFLLCFGVMNATQPTDSWRMWVAVGCLGVFTGLVTLRR